jgi:hypothetical protein
VNQRWRILLVVTRTPRRGPRFASSEPLGLPPHDAVMAAAQLLHLGAEVRVLDQNLERLSDRVARREARLWRADLVLLHAGGSALADNPVPDAAPLRELLSGWPPRAPLLATGPLAGRYAEELLETIPDLLGALRRGVHPSLVGAFEPDRVPGLLFRRAGSVVASAPAPDLQADLLPDVLPAWHALPLDACGARAPGGLRVAGVLCGGSDLDAALAQVRHAVRRAGARRIAFLDRNLARDRDFVEELARSMFAAAPNVAWTCRVRADRLDPMVALALANGGCREVLVTSPSDRDAPALLPMDDPGRPRIESAVEACRVTGMPVAVEHVIGRPGHSRDNLSAWQRWFSDRHMLVHAHVRVLHAGDKGPRTPSLAEAAERAGCWDNALRPKDVERAVRGVSEHSRLAAQTASA